MMLTRRLALSLALALVLPSSVVFLGLPNVRAVAGEPANKKAEADKSKEKLLQDQEYYELFRLFADTFDQIDRNYVKDVSRRQLVEAAVRGMLSELDPYSNYISPKQLDRFKAGVEAEFGGVGIQVSVEDGHLKVISPLVGTPAYRAGMMAGDHIVEIEGKTTKGITIDEAVRRMKGKVGTEVTVKVIHPNTTTPEEIKLKREIIRVQTVLGEERNADDSWNWMYDDEKKIGYIRVTAFARHTAEELRAALDNLTERGVQGLVLDLRFNPGGLLSSAIEVSDMFVDGGRIVSTEGRNAVPKTWDAHEKGTFKDFPMAILVNRYSASASEIVSGCLQDHDRAVVVGERTWGKGSVQNIVELEEGASALKLTTAGYRRPSGKNIHRFKDSEEDGEWGISPNDGFEVPLTRPEMTLLHKHWREKDIIRKQENGESDSDDGQESDFVDEQLKKGLEYLYKQLEVEKQADETVAAKEAAG
jgi:carboxyl-terminal processing protease